jgi:hypothetical protein
MKPVFGVFLLFHGPSKQLALTVNWFRAHASNRISNAA